jgi:lipoprotein-anchoring transpeptidase ErfK/SrfK
MKFRASVRSLSAILLLSVSAPLWSQTSAGAPVNAPVPQTPTGQTPPAPSAPVTAPGTPPPATTTQPTNPVVVDPPKSVAAPVAPVAPKVVKKKGPTDSLKPGQYVWDKQAAYEGPMKIVAVLDIQRIYIFQNDKLIGFSTISAGKKGKETPTGYFNILQKNIDHKSNLYSNAPMPYMQRLTWDGIALHGGHIPGYPASHGCIRLPHEFAKLLFGVTQMNQEVVVLKDTATPAKRPEPKPEPVIAPVTPVPTPVQPVITPAPVTPAPVKT